ncbi:hypothetical protein UFOVP43_28 [uncultured Caudovirales phage]|uniref:Uncharacterized protein n=1 Tax=uncultured Caudovirales phage TaxID=2100421 RepID=A0A6J5KRF6_9CAUD|nr:hypothetical protein UFOVP43_28 [uncultured Caudovirales phage]
MKFSYTTTLELADVIVCWSFDDDENGIYDSRIEKVIYNHIDVIDILSEEVLNDLDSEASQKFAEFMKGNV